MISRAINMLRSIRGSMEFYTDEERDNSNAEISVLESSPGSNGIVNNFADVTVVDEVEKSSHEFMAIQPRASIKMKGINSGTTRRAEENKSSEKSVERNNCEVRDNYNIDVDDDDDVMILEEVPENKVGLKKDSSCNAGSFLGKKELLCVDDEMPGPLVIDLDEKYNSLEESNDSQSSYHTSPQEVFDLCESEPKVYKLKKTEEIKGKNKMEIKTRPPVGRVTRSKVTEKGTTSNCALSQSLLQDCVNFTVNNVPNPSSCPSPKNKENLQEDKVEEMEEVKTVEDDTIRIKLPIQGKKKKKLFNLKMSQVIAMINEKNHPLHKWHNVITLQSMNELSQEDKKKMLKILIDFLEVKIVRIKG